MITFQNPSSPYRITKALGRGVQAHAYLCHADGEHFVLRVPERFTGFESEFLNRSASWRGSTRGLALPVETVAVLNDGAARIAHVAPFRGTSLRETLNAGPIADVAALMRLSHDLSGGIATLAAIGFHHLDLSPSNILVDEAGDAWICDFGNVTPIGSFDPKRHLDRGRYNAPLSFAANPDLFSLGLILYEAAVGEHLIVPFSASHTLQDLGRETRAQLATFYTGDRTLHPKYAAKLQRVPTGLRETILTYLSP